MEDRARDEGAVDEATHPPSDSEIMTTTSTDNIYHSTKTTDTMEVLIRKREIGDLVDNLGYEMSADDVDEVADMILDRADSDDRASARLMAEALYEWIDILRDAELKSAGPDRDAPLQGPIPSGTLSYIRDMDHVEDLDEAVEVYDETQKMAAREDEEIMAAFNK